MRILVIGLVALVSAALAPGAIAAGTKKVTIKSTGFSPKTVSITADQAGVGYLGALSKEVRWVKL